MPLTPAIRPFNAISSTAERPIRAPPAADAIGVKEVAVISVSTRAKGCPNISAAGGKVNGGLTLPLDFDPVRLGFLQPFPVISRRQREEDGRPVQRCPPVAHGGFCGRGRACRYSPGSPRVDAGCHGAA